MMPIRFMIRLDLSPRKRSRTSARDIATPAEAPTPCMKRAAMSDSMFGATGPQTLAAQ